MTYKECSPFFVSAKRPVVCQAVRVSALRFLEAALRGCGKDSCPTAVNEDVLDTAVELARKQLSARVAYRVAGQLELISELMNSKRFIVLRQRWHHGMNKPRELGSRISKESIEAREKKLPSAAVLRALANIFHQATKPMHILVSSYTALMLCAPERINEVLRLSRNCIVRGDGRFSGRVGIRWAGSKGASDTIKWIPSAMVSVAEKAVSNLLRVSLPAQQIAEWYTNNPKEIYMCACFIAWTIQLLLIPWVALGIGLSLKTFLSQRMMVQPFGFEVTALGTISICLPRWGG